MVKKQNVRELLSKAAALLRENETMFGDVRQDKEKANPLRPVPG